MPSATRKKPAKPYPSFPLTAHLNGQWCKKIRGRIHFFGVWADPDAALTKYHNVAADLHAGREPQANLPSGELTIKELTNRFLDYQRERVESGQIAPRSFEEYRRVLTHFVRRIGRERPAEQLTAAELLRYRTNLVRGGLTGARGLGVHALTRTLVCIRSAFRWAEAVGVIDRLPRWGDALNKPNIATVRRSRANRERIHDKNLLTASEIQTMLNEASLALRTAILLGINGGFGNTDCSSLPVAAVDLDAAIIRFERPKTTLARVVPLWPETVEAIRGLLTSSRPAPIDTATAGLVFHTESGRPLVRQRILQDDAGIIKKVTHIDRLGDWFETLLKQLKMKRRGIGFYSLRHTFRTWADEAKDQHAIHLIMGHAIPGMCGHYIEEISLDRLRAVVEHVRAKLWGG